MLLFIKIRGRFLRSITIIYNLMHAVDNCYFFEYNNVYVYTN